MKQFRDGYRHRASQRGFNLMEVLMGIAVFAIGMLALASLQGALSRSTAEAKVRTTAVNIAERIIEGQRGFAMISGGTFSFADIVNVTGDSPIYFDGSMTRKTADEDKVGVIYTVTQDVTDYYYDLAGDSFYTPTEDKPAPTGAVTADYKTVLVTVAWNDDRDFVIEEGTLTEDSLGGGSVQVSAAISQISVAAALKVSEEDDGDIIAPDIVYTPGQNPDIVSLDLGGQKFKESLTPEPKVYRDNLETRFDVVTYSQGIGSAIFLRREEFVAVSCECTLRLANADNPGKRPVIWAGDEYIEFDPVTKAYGEAISNIAQSPLCDTCCRDHHDGAGTGSELDPGAILYDPSRPEGVYPAGQYVSDGGDHVHYSRASGNSSVLPVASADDDYLEACKFVRVDGFFRLAQDFRLEGINSFPEDYLITSTEVADYSNYVTDQVYDLNISSETYTGTTPYANAAIGKGNGYHANASPPEVVPPLRASPGAIFTPNPLDPNDTLTFNYTNLPTSTGATFQQLRSRSIYIDYLSLDLRNVITCIEGAADDAAAMECESGDVKLDQSPSINVLEIIPFFELQTTFLNDWDKDTPTDLGYSVTNEPVETGNTHTRGKASKLLERGDSWVTAIANRGVSGLTATDPINNIDYELLGAGKIRVIIDPDNPADPEGKVITGVIRSDVGGLKAANLTITASEAICSYVSAKGEFTCFVPATANDPKMIIGNFQKPPKKICITSSNQAELPVVKLALTGSTTEDIGLGSALEVDLVSDPPIDPDYVLTLTDDDLLCGGAAGG